MTLKVGNLVKGQYSFNSTPLTCIVMATSSMDSISFYDLQFCVQGDKMASQTLLPIQLILLTIHFTSYPGEETRGFSRILLQASKYLAVAM